MTLVVGTDEAGYGPPLGPLVVVATAWRVEAPPESVEAVLTAAAAAVRRGDGRPLWDDSKRVLRGGAGFAALEAGALVGVALAADRPPRGWPALERALGAGPLGQAPEDGRLATLELPLETPVVDLEPLAALARDRLADGGVVVEAVRARVVRPAAFNVLLDRGLNKSDLLSQTTLDLAASLCAGRRDPTLVWCDRHGGRRRYAGLVARHFGGTLVRTVEETPARSVYELADAACHVEFSVGGESRAPVAVASMVAKYVRELAMRAFNAHWQARCPGLAPTAGYPVDAARWRREAAAAVDREGVAWEAVWRRS